MPQNVQPIIDPSKGTEWPFGYHTCQIAIGQKFGRLTVVAFAGRNNNGLLIWKCVCECGGETLAYGHGLKKGTKRSCGCLGRDATIQRSTTHGMTKTITYNSWRSMIRRCEAPRDIGYPRYGARGISVCDRWRQSFERFLEDMGERPSKSYQIERIANEGNYTPENCRWATRSEQARNRRSNRMLSFNGKTQCLSAWVEECGMTLKQLQNRITLGWSVERILTEPIRRRRKKQ